MQAAHLPHPLLIPLLASVILSLFSWGKYALYPFRLFTTWVHECCHALTALLVGGQVSRIILSRDTSGLTHYRIPKSRWRQALVASAGYPGACLVGCALYRLSFFPARDVLRLELGLGALVLLSGIFWFRGLFGSIAVLTLGSSLLALGWFGTQPYAKTLFAFLAIQTGMSAVMDIRALFDLNPGTRSDASTLQATLFLPAWFWATSWLLMSLVMTTWTVFHS
jgi:hypothetical protein